MVIMFLCILQMPLLYTSSALFLFQMNSQWCLFMHRTEKLHMYPVTASQEKEREIPLGTISAIRSYHGQRINSELFLNQAWENCMCKRYWRRAIGWSWWVGVLIRKVSLWRPCRCEILSSLCYQHELEESRASQMVCIWATCPEAATSPNMDWWCHISEAP